MKLVNFFEQFKNRETDVEISLYNGEIYTYLQIDDYKLLEFVIENLSEMMGYTALGNTNIRIHRDITGEMGFGVG
ncbi:MAG: hypothetical protein ACYSR7_01775 [Planctomycetota bacterium]